MNPYESPRADSGRVGIVIPRAFWIALTIMAIGFIPAIVVCVTPKNVLMDVMTIVWFGGCSTTLGVLHLR